MWEHPIIRLLGTDPKIVVGLMSGTSLDGIDVALVQILGHGVSATIQPLAFETVPLASELRGDIERLLDRRQSSSLADISALNFRLGRAFGEAALAIARDYTVDLIGSHGQTVWHQPPSMLGGSDAVASTLQIGEPAVIAAHTGAVTIGDFRVADLAVGGEGAPLVPFVDWVLFRKPGAIIALQNIGGIANVTVVGDRLEDVFAFDTGPGTIVIDALARIASEESMQIDKDGLLSASGKVQTNVLAELLDDDFLRLAPPKSTGRERYGQEFVSRLIGRHRSVQVVDLLATAVAFTAEAIAQSYRKFIFPRLELAGERFAGPTHGLHEILVSGGGALNPTLMAELRNRLNSIPVRPFNSSGVLGDSKEAVAFALLAVETIHASPANVQGATGASRAAILGKICIPPI